MSRPPNLLATRLLNHLTCRRSNLRYALQYNQHFNLPVPRLCNQVYSHQKILRCNQQCNRPHVHLGSLPRHQPRNLQFNHLSILRCNLPITHQINQQYNQQARLRHSHQKSPHQYHQHNHPPTPHISHPSSHQWLRACSLAGSPRDSRALSRLILLRFNLQVSLRFILQVKRPSSRRCSLRVTLRCNRVFNRAVIPPASQVVNPQLHRRCSHHLYRPNNQHYNPPLHLRYNLLSAHLLSHQSSHQHYLLHNQLHSQQHCLQINHRVIHPISPHTIRQYSRQCFQLLSLR